MRCAFWKEGAKANDCEVTISSTILQSISTVYMNMYVHVYHPLLFSDKKIFKRCIIFITSFTLLFVFFVVPQTP